MSIGTSNDAGPSDELWVIGDAYERYIGRWSRLVAQDFIAWLAPKPSLRWLDVGCGPGALTRAILMAAHPSAIVGVDPASGFISHAQQCLSDPRVAWRSASAEHLPFADVAFDVAVSGLMLNFLADPAKAVAEMARVTRPGGTIAAYVWDYGECMELIRFFWDAALMVDPAARAFDETRRFPICRPDALRRLFENAGLQRLAIHPIDVETVFADFDDYWSPFLGGQGPAPSYCLALTEGQRAELRERVKALLPIARDGRIHLVARAFAVSGITSAR